MKKACAVFLGAALLLILCVAVYVTLSRRSNGGPLAMAIMRGDVKSAKLELAKHPGLVNHVYGAGTRPIHFAALTTGSGAAMVDLLTSRGADPNTMDGVGDTPVMMATTPGRIATLHALLRHGGNPDILSRRGVTALHMAAWRGNADAVRALLKYGANVSIRDTTSRRYAPLHWAARFGRTNTASVLLNAGADVNAVSRDGTPSQVARTYDHPAVAKLIDGYAATHHP